MGTTTSLRCDCVISVLLARPSPTPSSSGLHSCSSHFRLKAAIGSDVKGNLSMVVYAVAIPMAFVNRWVAYGLYVAVALSWLVPDRRIERRVETERHPTGEGRS